MNNPTEILLITLKDTWRYRNLALFMFIFIAVIILMLSLKWPKMYVSTSVIEVDEQNILTPLLEGSAIATSVKDNARNAEQLILSKRSKNNVFIHFLDETSILTSQQQEEFWESIIDNISVQGAGSNLINISFRSADPAHALLLATILTDFFITESVEEKRRESEGAYQFIAEQAAQYHKKLLESEDALKTFRSDNLGADPASSAVVNDRILELQRSNEQSRLALNEAKIRMENIDAQLSGEAEVSAHLTREGQIQERINTLQSNLDTLRMTYLDSYPDVIIIKDQIETLKITMTNVSQEESTGLIQNGKLNPLFQELRAKRSKYTTELAALETRIEETSQLLVKEKARARQINNAVAVHAQLTRDYDGNQQLYEKLLKQRESARVSMNIDIANQGMTLKIKEKASLPITPIGLRFLHFVFVGTIGALLAPLGLMFLWGRIDSTFKSVSDLKAIQGLPVLGTVSSYRNKKDNLFLGIWIFFSLLIIVSILSAYAYVGWLKIAGNI